MVIGLHAELGRGIAMSSVFELGGTAVNKNTAMAMSGGTNYEPNMKDSNTALFKIKPIVPEKVTPRQIRLALARAGLLSQIEAALEDPDNKEAQISWEYSIEINRDDYLLNSFASSLGFTSQQLDQLFITAGNL